MSVTADLSGLMAVERMRGDILEEATMRAEFEIRPYVPIEEGILRASGQLASQFRAGLLVWATPYAANQYYIENRKHASPEGRATDHWDEAWARDRLPQWMDYVAAIYEGKMR